VALVFQSPDDQIVGSTVERDLAFGLENHGVPSPEIRRRVDEALEWSGLAPMARQPPHLLSEGEKQRLALASALILRPDVLLLDEPTSRLDPAARVRLAAEIDRAHRAGTAVVHVTHRSGELLVAERIVGLDGGVPVFVGTPAELVRSAHADGLGILWSGLHLFRRRLLARGLDHAESAGAGWNDLASVVGAMTA
jgi:energy-coupling factor transport system ATP-binding protein